MIGGGFPPYVANVMAQNGGKIFNTPDKTIYTTFDVRLQCCVSKGGVGYDGVGFGVGCDVGYDVGCDVGCDVGYDGVGWMSVMMCWV